MTDVVNKTAAEGDVETSTTIGMDGHSGFSKLRMCRFSFGNFSAYLGAYFIGSLSTLYVSVYRAQGTSIVSGQMFLKLFGGFLGVVMGIIQDSPKTAICLNKLGCTNAKCGRRAPHAVWATIVLVFATLLTHTPPNIATMATSQDSTAKLKDEKFSKYRVSTSISDSGEPKWGDWQAWGDGLLDKTKGFPCDKMLNLNTTSGVIHTFHRVGEVNKKIPEFGSDICASMVSLTAFCYPGPAGSPKTGDGGDRVCAETDSASLAGWFIFMGIIGRIGWETIWQVSHVAKWEIFPYQQDRVKIQTWSAVLFFFAFTLFIVFNLLITQSSEFGSRPEGGNGYRFLLSVIAASLISLGFLAIGPFSEAKQTTGEEQKNSRPLQDYIDIITSNGKPQSAMRWASMAYGLVTFHTTIYVATAQYYFVYTLNIPVSEAATGIAVLAITNILCDLLGVPVWGWAFGVRNKEDRLKSRDPRNAMMVACVMSVGFGATVQAVLARPVNRDEINNNYLALVISLFVIRAPTTLFVYWSIGADGWCIDEDCQEYFKETGKRRRRESVYKGFQLAIRGIADFLVLVIVLAIFSTSCDSTMASQNQTMECAGTFYFMWQIGLPLTMIAVLICVWKFPITGERKNRVIEGQAKFHRAVGSARKTVTGSTPVTASNVEVINTGEATEATPDEDHI
eukprot:g8176.t1